MRPQGVKKVGSGGKFARLAAAPVFQTQNGEKIMTYEELKKFHGQYVKLVSSDGSDYVEDWVIVDENSVINTGDIVVMAVLHHHIANVYPVPPTYPRPPMEEVLRHPLIRAVYSGPRTWEVE